MVGLNKSFYMKKPHPLASPNAVNRPEVFKGNLDSVHWYVVEYNKICSGRKQKKIQHVMFFDVAYMLRGLVLFFDINFFFFNNHMLNLPFPLLVSGIPFLL